MDRVACVPDTIPDIEPQTLVDADGATDPVHRRPPLQSTPAQAWHELHVAFGMRLIRLEDAALRAPEERARRSAEKLVIGVRGAGLLLEDLQRRADAARLPLDAWIESVEDVYAWVDNILDFTTEALEDCGHCEERFAHAMWALAAYSGVQARGVLLPGIGRAVSQHEAVGDAQQIDAWRRLALRISTLEAALASLAFGR
jgi:hypothetical protein